MGEELDIAKLKEAAEKALSRDRLMPLEPTTILALIGRVERNEKGDE